MFESEVVVSSILFFFWSFVFSHRSLWRIFTRKEIRSLPLRVAKKKIYLPAATLDFIFFLVYSFSFEEALRAISRRSTALKEQNCHLSHVEIDEVLSLFYLKWRFRIIFFLFSYQSKLPHAWRRSQNSFPRYSAKLDCISYRTPSWWKRQYPVI